MNLKLILTLLTVVNLFNYIDRGLVAGAGTSIKGCVESIDQCSRDSHKQEKECPDGGGEHREIVGCTTRCRVCGTQCSQTDEVVTQTGFGITDFDLGIIQSSFMLGYMGGSFVFSSLASKGVRVYRLLAIGMSIWTLSALVCAFSGWYGSKYVLLMGRVGSGVGEAALATTALPHLDDLVPETLKGRYMSIYFCALPVGTAMGFVFAGVISETLSWEWTFLLEAMCMPPFIIIFLLTPSLQQYTIARKIQQATPEDTDNFLLVLEEESETEEGAQMDDALVASPVTVRSMRNVVWKEIMLCLKSTPFLLTAMGLAMYTFTTAGLAFYMPQYLQTAHPCDKSWAFTNTEADLAFGAMTVVSGFCGVLAGGAALDYFAGGSGEMTEAEAQKHQVVQALRISFFLLVVSTVLLFIALFASDVRVFFLLCAVCVFVVISTTTPSSRALLGSVPTEARPVAVRYFQQSYLILTLPHRRRWHCPIPFITCLVMYRRQFSLAQFQMRTPPHSHCWWLGLVY